MAKISKRTWTVKIKGNKEVLTVRSPKGRSDGQDLKGKEVRGDRDTRGRLGLIDQDRMAPNKGAVRTERTGQ